MSAAMPSGSGRYHFRCVPTPSAFGKRKLAPNSANRADAIPGVPFRGQSMPLNFKLMTLGRPWVLWRLTSASIQWKKRTEETSPRLVKSLHQIYGVKIVPRGRHFPAVQSPSAH